MNALERLLAREEICELKARYCRLLDTKRWEVWGQIFTEDVEMDVGDDVAPEHGSPLVRGRDVVVTQTRHFVGTAQTVHHVHTPEIAFQDDEHASGIWAMYDRVIFGPNPPVPLKSIIGHGHYHERYVRGLDGWRIDAIRLTRIAMTKEPLSAASAL